MKWQQTYIYGHLSYNKAKAFFHTSEGYYFTSNNYIDHTTICTW